MPAMDLISIIIVNYNTPKDTKECLVSLGAIRTTGFRFNVIVVDNGSKEPLQLTADDRYPEYELIRSESNLGFTGGNNLGISHAVKQYQADYFLLLNSDTVVDEDFLVHLYRALKDNPKAGIAGSKIYFHRGFEYHNKSYRRDQRHQVLWYAGGSVDWENLVSFHRGVDEVDRGQFDHQETSDFVTGCSLLIKREMTERVGILDKRFFLYSEDVDYSLRVKRAGYEVLFVPKSIVWHKIGRSSGGAGSKLQQYYQTRNRLLLTFTHGDLKAKFAALRLIGRWIKDGSSAERQGVTDFILGRLGKQPIV